MRMRYKMTDEIPSKAASFQDRELQTIAQCNGRGKLQELQNNQISLSEAKVVQT